MEMGPPLLIINEFIHTKTGDEKKRGVRGMILILFQMHMIEYLRKLLISRVPKDLRTQNKLKWDKKIDDLVICYVEYANI